MPKARPVRHVAIYARLSVSSDESVSISRQIDACTKYAASRGWEVVATFTDDGVSATHNRPEARAGWRALLDAGERYDAVIVWKIDRLARRVIDFLHADEALQARGAGLVAVEDPIDMTTAQGRAFATVLAVFGELEAASISARVADARTHLLKSGRVVGGTVPFGYRSIPNPDGPGLVLAQDPKTIGVVREEVRRALAGETVYAITKATGRSYSTVERSLRHPILAGMTPFNPGNETRTRGDDVLRGSDGLPIVNESLALISPAQRRELLVILDDDDKPQRKPRASQRRTSPFLSRLAVCDACDLTMLRGTRAGRAVLYCKGCHQSIAAEHVAEYLRERLLADRGDYPVGELDDEQPDDTASLAEIDHALSELGAMITRPGADRVALLDQIDALNELRERAAAERTEPVFRVKWSTVRAGWDAAADDLERRDVLCSQLGTVRIRRGEHTGGRLPGGGYFDASRVLVVWRTWNSLPTVTWLTPDDPNDLDDFGRVPR